MFSTRDRFREIVAAAPSGAARKKHPGKAVLAGTSCYTRIIVQKYIDVLSYFLLHSH